MTSTAFDDLNFEPHPNWDGVRAVMCFPNGYVASVIKSSHSYGGPDGLYELAVMKGTKDDHDLCYDTPITDDVIGHLTPDRVDVLLSEIAALAKSE